MKWELICVIEPEGDWYVSYCEELGIASQGETVNEAKRNLEEAIEMFLEEATHSEIMGHLASLKPELPSGIQHHPEISVVQHQEGQGTQWEIVVG